MIPNSLKVQPSGSALVGRRDMAFEAVQNCVVCLYDFLAFMHLDKLY